MSKLNKTILSIISAVVLSLGLVSPVHAETTTKVEVRRDGSSAHVEIKQNINTSNTNIQEVQQEVIKTINGKRIEFKQDLKTKIASKVADLKRFFGGFAVLKQGNVTAVSDSTITVESDGKTYTVNVSSDTKLRRRFFGKSDTGEMQVGHTVNVYGRWTNEEHTTIDGILVRDISIQKRFAVFVGVLKLISDNTWKLDTHRGTQTVTVSGDTKFVNRKNESITQAEVQVDHKIRVKGLWDRSTNTVTEVEHVKDYVLPKVEITVSPTATLTPIPTP